MILDHLDRASRYERVHPGFAAALGFLRRPDLADLPDGKHAISESAVFAIVERGKGRDGVSPLEAHRRYIDIQYVIAGEERMGWSPLECLSATHEYSEQKDIQFFQGEPRFWFPMHPGEFAVFLPTDAHAPLAGSGPIHKAVVKVAVDYTA